MFHEDVVQVVRKRLEQEEDLPEEKRPTALARSYYLKVRVQRLKCILSVVMLGKRKEIVN